MRRRAPCRSLFETRRPPANPGQGSFKRGQRSCGRARRGAPIPRQPAACLRQRALLGWPAESQVLLTARRLQACSGMGQQASRERQRLQEIRRLLSRADDTLSSLLITAATEAAAGIPAAPGSAQAQYNAVYDNYSRLTDEQTAIVRRMSELCRTRLAARGEHSQCRCLRRHPTSP